MISGKHLLNLINDILDLLKIEAGKMERDYKNFELANKLYTIRNLLSPIADRKNIKIEIDMCSKFTNICADEDKFVQIMYNLVDNAIKFSYENSLVKIGARKKGDLVEITVKDTELALELKTSINFLNRLARLICFPPENTRELGSVFL